MPTDPPAGLPGAVLHVDMDAFYAAVEVLDAPELAGKPVIVGGSPHRRGVVSAASYEARAFGVHSAMPTRTAAARCPGAVFRPVRMERYRDVSRQIMRILHEYTPRIEKLSVDEAFLDVQSVLWRWKSPRTMAESIKERVLRETGCTASVGVAANKFLAKLASDMEKPDGLTCVPADPDELRSFLAPLPVQRIWGVGRKTLEQLHGLGIRTVGDLQTAEPAILSAELGRDRTHHLQQLAYGRDDRPVITYAPAKSISSEHTFDQDTDEEARILEALHREVEQVGHRLRKADRFARTAFMKIRFSSFETLTRQLSFPRPVRSDRDLLQAARSLFNAVERKEPVRLIGFGVANLLDRRSEQQDLFQPTHEVLPPIRRRRPS